MKYLLFTDCANLGIPTPKNEEKVKPEHFKVYNDIHKLKAYLSSRCYKGEFDMLEQKEYLDEFFNNISNLECNKLVEIKDCSLNDCCCQSFLYRTEDEPENVKFTLDDVKTMFPKTSI